MNKKDLANVFIKDSLKGYAIPLRITTKQAKKVADILGYNFEAMNKLERNFFKMDCICAYQNGYFEPRLYESLINK